MTFARLLPCALLLALGACGDKRPDTAKERKTAAGQVLGGTIDDAMLPLGTVTSQSPPLGNTASGSAQAASGDEDKPSAKSSTAAKPSGADAAAASSTAAADAEGERPD